MATSFKTFDPTKDSVVTRNLLHEAIPVTGTIVSGTYSDNNIKNYSHGMFQSVYDYPYLSSSANHIFDLTAGYPATSSLSGTSAEHVQNTKKINIYNQMAQVLAGFDAQGVVRQFDEDGDLTAGTKIDEAYFINLTRLLSKDEVKKGSFTLTLGVDADYATPFEETITISDSSGSSGYKVNSPAGEYGILFAKNGTGTPMSIGGVTVGMPCGLLYYQAGIAVLSASVFGSGSSDSPGLLSIPVSMSLTEGVASYPSASVSASFIGSAISGACDALRHRIENLSFNNTTELNSTIYFCRANNTDFNYSSNPTYLSSSKIVVKTDAQDVPVSYVTSVGLYSADNELLAVAKLSEPLKKNPATEFTVRVRLDY
tara:strand:- start:62 stop:1171 length:1110 start_codon:yes stop_codon:yes gene_type:complete